MKQLLLLVGLVAVVAIGAIMYRNGLISRDEQVKAGWSQIDTQLQRRADLIPNLVSTVKGYATHEKDLFEHVADARNRLLSAQGPTAKAEASADMNNWVGRLLAIAENYPNLKANESFVRLQDELAGTENRIAVARTRYNEDVKNYNAAIRGFPGSIFAPGLAMKIAEYFQPPESKQLQEPPKVQF
ncbi:MAG: LemA family protein [Kiritimatiellia bacterium]